MPRSVLVNKSPAYPYGLTQDLIGKLTDAGLQTVGQLAVADDRKLDDIDYVGSVTIKRIRAEGSASYLDVTSGYKMMKRAAINLTNSISE